MKVDYNYYDTGKVGDILVNKLGDVIMLTKSLGSSDDIKEDWQYTVLRQDEKRIYRDRITVPTIGDYITAFRDVTLAEIEQEYPELFI